MSRMPILTILGSTGSGKSRLGIELASRFSGEIISADSMQVYKGLDIVTAKVTKEERAMAPHHMLDIVDPLTPNFTVIQFRDMTLPIIDDLLAKKKLPIIVGGTNYYIESLLWHILIADPKKSPDEEQNARSGKRKVEADRSTENSEGLFEKLTKVDPEMANRLHPNNKRKIIRSLEVFEQHGIKHSELLKAQRTTGGCGLGGPLRFRNSIILWLRCERKVLDERLEDRVDSMVDAGLIEELLDFHRRYNKERIKSNTSVDYTKGIFQTIGFKEFHDYLVLSNEERQEKKGQKLLERGIEDLKLVTKRYAKKQEKWIMNRLIRRSDRQVPAVYTLDCTNLNEWSSNVYDAAVEIVNSILRGAKPEQKPFNEEVQNTKNSDSSNDEKHYCDVCERIFVGDLQWNIHLKGNKHMKVLKRQKQLAQGQQEMINS